LEQRQPRVHRLQELKQLVVPRESRFFFIRPMRVDEQRGHNGNEKRKEGHAAHDHHATEKASPAGVRHYIAVADRTERHDRPPHAGDKAVEVLAVDQMRYQARDDRRDRGYTNQIRENATVLNGDHRATLKPRLHAPDRTLLIAHSRTLAPGPDDRT